MSQAQKISSTTEAFMKSLGPNCGGCENLATIKCPFFKAATEGQPVQVAQEIQLAVAEMQAGQDLNSCDNG